MQKYAKIQWIKNAAEIGISFDRENLNEFQMTDLITFPLVGRNSIFAIRGKFSNIEHAGKVSIHNRWL